MFWLWIVFFIMSCVGAKISLLSNANHGGKWFWIACILSSAPYFPLITLLSKNILMDSLIYDFIILIVYTGIYILNGAAKSFTLIQSIGLIFTVLGLMLMKLKI